MDKSLEVSNMSLYDVWGDGCLISGQPIITEKGYVNIEDISIGDNVYTHMGRFRKVTKTTSKYYKGKIISIRINGYHIPIRIAEKHPIYVFRGGKKERNMGKFEWVEAKDIKLNDKIIYCCGEERYEPYEYNLAGIIGLYMIFGYIDSSDRIVIDTENKKDVIESIEYCTKELDITTEEFFFNNTKYIMLKDTTCLVELCREFGPKGTRFIPEKLINSSIPFLREFIKPFILSNKDRNLEMFFRASSSLDMFLGYQRILLRLNSFSNTYKCDSRNKEFFYYVMSLNRTELERVGKKEKDLWFRNFHHAFFRVDEVSVEEFYGNVYGLCVEEDESFCNHLITVNSRYNPK
jgi:intein/homing endonuclease